MENSSNLSLESLKESFEEIWEFNQGTMGYLLSPEGFEKFKRYPDLIKLLENEKAKEIFMDKYRADGLSLHNDGVCFALSAIFLEWIYNRGVRGSIIRRTDFIQACSSDKGRELIEFLHKSEEENYNEDILEKGKENLKKMGFEYEIEEKHFGVYLTQFAALYSLPYDIPISQSTCAVTLSFNGEDNEEFENAVNETINLHKIMRNYGDSNLNFLIFKSESKNNSNNVRHALAFFRCPINKKIYIMDPNYGLYQTDDNNLDDKFSNLYRFIHRYTNGWDIKEDIDDELKVIKTKDTNSVSLLWIPLGDCC
ncbi:hypothetical protein [Francisella sp. SYW-2]|uniref:hypothetical protein n=1 Tax=Francisella sp. SYW-2 TaxID=2610886 RepID=UPI00123D8AC4|nr:hypothetical protein [Francisella sp. SYW-2]